jgi:Calx-beta domain/FG-GAP-like repeat/FG-GAP repeat/Domain of unknown function (DUF4214)
MKPSFLTLVRSARLSNNRPRRFTFHHRVVSVAILLSLAFLSLFTSDPVAEAVAPNFAPRQDFSTGISPRSVAVGDINGDGKLDLAVANNSFSAVSVLLNTTAPGATTPSFSPKEDFTANTNPAFVVVRDLNLDGKPDLAVASGSNTVSVLLNTTSPGAATPSFSLKQDFGVGGDPVSIDVADLNRDGTLDLAVANGNSNSVSVLLNNTAPCAAMPAFSARQDFDTGSGPQSVRLGDLNGDGNVDMVAANIGSATVSVFLNTGAPGSVTASFAARQDFGAGAQPQALALGDLNGDGKLDLAVTNQGPGTVSVLFNTTTPGAVTASFAVKQDFGAGNEPRSITLGDLNRDGKLDLAVANSLSATTSVLMNTTAPGAAAPSFSPKKDFTTGTQPQSVAAGDLNGDGKLDLVATNFSDFTVSVLLNTTALAGKPAFGFREDFGTGFGPNEATSGDFNGDGKLDLVTANPGNATNTVSVLLNTTAPGAATTSFAAKQDFATDSLPQSVAVGDLNGDGRLDIVTANSGAHTVSVLLNNMAAGAATPSFAAKQDFATNTSPQSVTVGDLNGDGKLDLVTANSSNSLSVLLNTTAPGAAVPSFAAKQDFTAGSVSESVAVGDLNGDGRLDLVAGNTSSSTASVLFNTTAPGAASLSFATKQDFATGPTPVSVTLGDFNGDGKLDLAVANIAGPTVSVLLNTTAPGAAAPSFAAKQDFALGALPQCVTAGDLSGDGRLDLAIASPTSNTVTFLVNTTAPGADTPSFAARQDVSMGGNPACVALADLNGDGKLDLASPDGNGSFVSVHLNTVIISLVQPSLTVSESAGFVTITVIRAFDTTTPVSVDYSTSADNGQPCSNAGGRATPKCDFTPAVGRLNFEAGETIKTITIPINQDSFVEGVETFSLTLSNLTGGAVFIGSSTASITIEDDASEPPANPIDDSRNFVRQHYHDFLNRRPDQVGWDFWTNQITSCGADVQCIEVRRIDVSASFFLSTEFQQTGYLVERVYKVSYGDGTGSSTFGGQHSLPVPIVRVNEFLTDTQRIGRGVVVLAPNWEQLLESNKQAYTLEFVQTSRFVAALPTTMTPAQFVDMLNQNAGLVLSTTERTTAINLFSGSPNTSNLTARAQAVRQVAEDTDLYNSEFNRAFVLAEYFGYLRRNPNDAPEATLDYTGYDFWLTKLNQFNGNYISAEMVKGFLSSIEYRNRFGP